MSKAADQLAARAARAASRRTEEVAQVEESATSSRRTTKPRTAKVRITVDLAPLLYRRLGAWCTDAAEKLGVPKVHAADVLRALIEEVDADPQLAQAIRDRLRSVDR
jgi:hypothetical protein